MNRSPDTEIGPGEGPARRTEQREAITEALGRSPAPVTAQELHARLRAEGSSVGLATVYRNLQRLAAERAADTLRRDSGELAFRVCGAGHHHHLTCKVCGRVDEVRDCDLGQWTARIAREHGFSEVEHEAELVGVCRSCAASH